jgi:hypothetical protein
VRWTIANAREFAALVRASLQRDLDQDLALVQLRLSETMRTHGVKAFQAQDIAALTHQGQTDYQLDSNSIKNLTSLVNRLDLSLSSLVLAVRGQTNDDFRPNKALDPGRLERLLGNYPLVRVVVDAAAVGFTPTWNQRDPHQDRPPPNHTGARQHPNILLKAIREGQDAGQYLVLDDQVMSKWTHVQCSPFTVIEKGNVDIQLDGRLIHDLSFPHGHSTNDHTVRSSLPTVTWGMITRVAIRIETLRQRRTATRRIKGQCGDVKGAFRHLRSHHLHTKWFGGHIASHKALVLDLAAPFGWAGSPYYYGAFGNAISWIVGNESPATMASSPSTDVEPFFAFEFVDDHILLEVEDEEGERLATAELTLRLAMMAVLGPTAINEKKFSGWTSNLKALGLEWDLEHCSVSIPEEKIAKALARVSRVHNRGSTTKKELQQLLGISRHVCTCIQPAMAFVQRLQNACNSAPIHRSFRLDGGSWNDLQWLQAILEHGRLRHIPTSLFAKRHDPDVHLYMDASDVGLVVLDPSASRYIQLWFSDEETSWINNPQAHSFTINVREHFGCALALVLWGSSWSDPRQNTTVHIHAHVDNTSSVAWVNRRYSPNQLGQELNRAMGLAEATHGLHLTATHIAGSLNQMADAGSRATTQPHTSLWLSLSKGWTSTPVPATARTLYLTFSSTSNPKHWPRAPGRPTPTHGSSGRRGGGTNTKTSGSAATSKTTPNSSSSSLSANGKENEGLAWLPPPCGPDLATLRGIIVKPSVTPSPSTADTY